MIKFRQKLTAGLKGGYRGAMIGGLLTPGNIILALCGKKKAALILTAIGAGIGTGIGFYYGWKGEKAIEDYQKKLKEDPKFREQEKGKLRAHIKEALTLKPGSPITKKDLDSSPIQYRPDAYHYLEVYDEFSKKYRAKWIRAWENLGSLSEIDMSFEIVFPEPYESTRDDIEWEPEHYIAANGNAASDHYWIMWDGDKNEYNNNLGSGRGTGKTLLEAAQNFAAQWLVDETKINIPGILRTARIHNEVIREFLKLR